VHTIVEIFRNEQAIGGNGYWAHVIEGLLIANVSTSDALLEQIDSRLHEQRISTPSLMIVPAMTGVLSAATWQDSRGNQRNETFAKNVPATIGKMFLDAVSMGGVPDQEVNAFKGALGNYFGMCPEQEVLIRAQKMADEVTQILRVDESALTLYREMVTKLFNLLPCTAQLKGLDAGFVEAFKKKVAQ
jgi:hypothetical protein